MNYLNATNICKKMIKVSIIFVYYNTPNEIINAVKSVKNAVGNYSYEILIINNNSPIGLPFKKLIKHKTKIIENSKNSGYGAALNQGAKIAQGKYLVLSNSDLIFQKEAISFMIQKVEKDSKIGIIGPQFLNSKKEISKVCSDIPFLPQAIFPLSSLNNLFPQNKYSKNYHLDGFTGENEVEVPAICGACMLIKKATFIKISGFDERFFMYFEEADICYRIFKAGFKVLYFPSAKVIHFIGKSSDDKIWIRKTFEKSRYEFFKKYHGKIAGTLGESVIRLINHSALVFRI